MTGQVSHRPYKNTAAALIFSVIMGPVGLLYASLRGGVIMILLGLGVLAFHNLFSLMLFWLACSIWAVAAVEKYNQRIEALRDQH